MGILNNLNIDSLLVQITEVLFNPQFFRSFFFGLVVLFFLVIFIYFVSSSWQGKSLAKIRQAERESWLKELSSYKDKNDELSRLTDSLRSQLEVKERQISELAKVREELRRKEATLNNEISENQKLSSALNKAQEQVVALQNEIKRLNSNLELQAKVGSSVEALREELRQKEELLRNEALAKDKFCSELKNTESQLSKAQDELRYSQEVHQGLKEQYQELERQADALKQQLALEKTLYQKLKEEHSACKSTIPLQPPQK